MQCSVATQGITALTAMPCCMQCTGLICSAVKAVLRVLGVETEVTEKNVQAAGRMVSDMADPVEEASEDINGTREKEPRFSL